MSLTDIFGGGSGNFVGILNDWERMKMFQSQLSSNAGAYQGGYLPQPNSENSKNEVDSNEKLLLLIED
jgi:hypothetical protein